ncbi:MAG: response regulator transcription factor [bacterium]|nr:response regulator transcription factor [bacterium]
MTNKEPYSVIIVEDEEPAIVVLTDFIEKRPELEIAHIATDGDEALEKLTQEKYDLLFLDIQLPFLSGIEVVDQLEDIPYVIFSTAYDKYAIKAFDVGAVDYLLKPFTRERFNEAVDKFLKAKRENKRYAYTPKNFSLSFKQDKQQCLVAYQDIIYISSSGKNTVIHTEDRDFETPTLLKDLEEKLPENIFLRVHKQYIVNRSFITRIRSEGGGYHMVVLNDEDQSPIPVGRAYASQVREQFD